VDFESASSNLAEIAKAGSVFVRTNVPLIDFTRPFQGSLDIYGQSNTLSFDLSTIDDLPTISYLLTTVLDAKVLIIAWDIKEVMTYFKFHLQNKAIFKFEGKVIDLRLVEAFCGEKLPPPESLIQSKKRLAVNYRNPKVQLVHEKIHLPLALEVIPSMETQGILHTELKKKTYPFYEIEGQVNGRLQGSNAFPTALNPHAFTQVEKSKLKLRSELDMFLYFDFVSMEVATLQYLSDDPALKIVTAGGDYYKNIWKMLFGKECEKPEQRTFIKNSFLPIVFGQGAKAISEIFGCTETDAVGLIKALKIKFSRSFAYVDAFQYGITEDKMVEDHFGRKRHFQADMSYLVRNFVVQAPASIVCLEKLIDLYRIVGEKLIFSIHDGYVIRCDPKVDKQLIVKCKKSLESASSMAPGLQLSANCELGVKLDKTKSIKL
jgi:hypothetical protein